MLQLSHVTILAYDLIGCPERVKGAGVVAAADLNLLGLPYEGS